MTATLAWIVGRGGFMGSRVERLLPEEISGARAWIPKRKSWSWGEERRIGDELADEAAALHRGARAAGASWMVLWCAGAGGVGTDAEELRAESRALSRLLEALASLQSGAKSVWPGALLHCSSGGGVYGGVEDLPLTESSPLRAISVYGRNKLYQEDLVRRWSERTAGVSSLIARISNLYGPGQKLSRSAGLLSRLSLSIVHRRPLNIYVPLDTLRDYIHVDDAARYLLRCLGRLRDAGCDRVVVKIIASEHSMSIAGAVGIFSRVAKRRPQLVCIPAGLNLQQPSRLRFHSTIWADLAPHMTELAVGIHQLHQRHLAQYRAGQLPAPLV